MQSAVVAISRDCLWRWAPFTEQYWWQSPDRPGIGCFGTGFNNWGVQTNHKYLGAMAVLASDDAPCDRHGYSQEQALERAMAALRYTLGTHLTGNFDRTDGTRWGHTWITGLGIERMMHGVERIQSYLSDEDRAALDFVIADEADWLCTDYHRSAEQGVHAGLWAKDGGNDPESNIWNGAICARAALRCPDHRHVDQWMERAHLFFVNGISVPADAEDDAVLAGRKVSDWHLGANFFPNYALDHHMYLNVGYMVICLSNIAMLHYAFAERGKEAPETLYHHAADLWALVRRLFFTDGRLLRMGGDSRIRYCYCQDYVVPTLVFAADCWGDPHALDLLRSAVELARREQSFSGDGRFLCSRLDEMVRKSPLYFCRIEADRSVALSQAVAWLSGRTVEIAPDGPDYEASVGGGWAEPEHGAVFHRSATRFASWSWHACENPQGLCLPPSDGDLAEWQENLSGRVHGLGPDIKRWLREHSQWTFEGGFLTVGAFIDRTAPGIAEGWGEQELARHQVAFAALPDGHTCVRLEHAETPPHRVYLGGWEGVKLEIPNDVFNGRTRRYRTAAGEVEIEGHLGDAKVTDFASRWVSIDDAIGLVGIYGAEAWTLLQRGHRIGGHAVGNLLTDTLCYQFSRDACDITGGRVVLDNGCVVLSSVDAAACEAAAGNARQTAIDGPAGAAACRAVVLRGQDGDTYLMAAHFGAEAVTVALDDIEGTWGDLVSGEALDMGTQAALELSAGGARLFKKMDRE